MARQEFVLPDVRRDRGGGEAGMFRRGGTVHGLFAWCAARYTDAVAVVHRESRLTYAELDALSDLYATELDRAGISRGDIVPVIMKRSPEMIAALLAVLKCGAVYSAMDPRWPSERVAALVARLHARMAVTDVGGPSPLPAWMPPGHDPVAPACRYEAVPVGPDDACSILFTSGTTGMPRAVVSAHGGIARLFDVCDWMPQGPGVTIPQVSAPSWDGFAIDAWGPLLTGGTTVLVDEPILAPAALRGLHDREGVNVVFLTTSLFNMLVDEGVQSFTGIHTVLIGGEKASPAHAKRFLESHPGSRLFNLYGPSECGVLASTHEVSLDDCLAADGIPIGRAAPHTQIYVLDGDRVCQHGEIGEICLAGRGVAVGYLDDAEFTARKFPCLYLDGASTRVYRTGDQGHWTDDQTLCFHGRSDMQVQVRGYRVEPDEIEQVAGQVTGVSMAAVVPLGRDGVVDSLALFYTSPDATVSEATLAAELNRQLPAYLVPRHIRRLDRFPLLANGKLDRQLLAAILSAVGFASPTGEEPQDDSEIAVARVFSEILGIATVPRTVSFLELGGDSLSVARLSARLEQAIGVKVTVSQVYRNPTVAQLGAWLRAERRDTPAPQATVPQRTGGGLIPLTPMQATLITLPITSDLAWWIDGWVDADALERTVGDIHRRHQALHARYITSGPDIGHATIPGSPGRASFHRLPPARTDTAACEALRALLEQPLRVEDGDVWRCALVHSEESGRGLLGFVVHHGAFDGTSAMILATELSQAYLAHRPGGGPGLRTPAAALADFEADYRRQLAAIDTAAQRQYWLGELRGLQPCHFRGRSPESHPPAGPVTVEALAVHPDQLRLWEAYARRGGMTGFVWVAAAYAKALIQAGAQPDLGLVVTIANRGSALVDRSITCRMGLVCLRPNGPSRAGLHLLARMNDAYSKAMAAADVFFDPAHISGVLSELEADAPSLQAGSPHLLYHEIPEPGIQLGDAIGKPAPEFGGWAFLAADLCLEVQPTPESGLAARMVVRSDIYPAGLAVSIGRNFLKIIEDGPGPLEKEPAS